MPYSKICAKIVSMNINLKNKRIDLHMHSVYSDGTYTPKELVLEAKKREVYAISLTDHDTHEGIEEASREASEAGIIFIPGVELSSKFNIGPFSSTDLHILAYGFDVKNSRLNEKLAFFIQKRFERNMEIIEAFKTYGIDIDYNELQGMSGKNIITKVHFVKYLLEKNIVKEREEGFQRFFVGDVITNIDKITLEPKECIELIKSSGGKAVLAHPFRYKMNTGELVDTLAKLDIDGIEAIYPTHTKEEEEFLKEKAKKNGLFITGGSDFHGDNRKSIHIGYVDAFYPLLEALL